MDSKYTKQLIGIASDIKEVLTEIETITYERTPNMQETYNKLKEAEMWVDLEVRRSQEFDRISKKLKE